MCWVRKVEQILVPEKRVTGRGDSVNKGMEIQGSASSSDAWGKGEAWRKMRLEW